MDGINFRFSMPTGWCAKAIPQDIIERAEKIYRDELCKAIPAAKDDELYKLAYTQACAFHLLKQLTDINSCLDTNEIWRGPAIEGSLWNAKTNFLRPRFISRLQTFIDVATENNLYPAIRQMAAETLAKIKELWPDAKPLDFYPAFNTVSLQSKASSSGDINKCLGVTTSTTQLQHVEEVSHNEDREGVKQVAAPLSPPNDIKPSISSEDTPVPTKSVSPSKPGK